MNALLRGATGPLTAASAAERTRRRQGAATLPSEADTVDQDLEDMQSNPMPADLVDRPSYPTRMRKILILSIISWMIVALAIAWAISRF